MGKTIFILGAGASKEAGAPLMKEFVDVAESLYATGQIDNDSKESFELVFKAYHELKAIYANAYLEIDNIESLFASFEMAKLLGRLGNLPPESLDKLPDAIKHVIEKTLELTVDFISSIQNGKQFDNVTVRPANGYAQFGAMLRDYFDKSKNYGNVSVITFNYDICIDHTLIFHGIPLDYCLERSEQGAVKVLKLHGSLNWAYCDKCSKVIPFDETFFESGLTVRSSSSASHVKKKYNATAKLKGFKHCEQNASSLMIVPPTWSKGQFHNQIKEVWQSAAKELAAAENIFICGYSMPETDMFFRYLYALGSIGERRIKKLWVFDTDTSAEFKKRYENLLGPLIKNSRFDLINKDFLNSIGNFSKELIK
jgi:hypothetical protein